MRNEAPKFDEIRIFDAVFLVFSITHLIPVPPFSIKRICHWAIASFPSVQAKYLDRATRSEQVGDRLAGDGGCSGVNRYDADVFEHLTAHHRLLLYSAGALDRSLRTKARIHQMMFLCSKALPEIFHDDLPFDELSKGPHSDEVEALLLEMEDVGLISLKNCALTGSGRRLLRLISPKEPLKSVLDGYKELVTSLNDDELLTLIYVNFPSFQDNAQEWERLKSMRVRTAASMMRKQAVSFSKALEISDLDSDSFAEVLGSKRIRWRDA